jgi:hypothetical protein
MVRKQLPKTITLFGKRLTNIKKRRISTWTWKSRSDGRLTLRLCCRTQPYGVVEAEVYLADAIIGRGAAANDVRARRSAINNAKLWMFRVKSLLYNV